MNERMPPLTHIRQHWTLWLSVGLGTLVLAMLINWIVRPARIAPIAPPTAEAAGATGANTSAPGALAGARTNEPGTRRAAAGSGLWSALTEQEQAALAPLREGWPDLTTGQRLKWFDVAQRFSGLLADEQQRVQARMADWARMTPAERGTARLNFQELRQLSQKERLERWEAYQGLDPDERKQLAERGQTAPTGTATRRTDLQSPTPKSTAAATEAMANLPVAARAVGATVVQAPLGATTVLVSRIPTASASTTGPKIAATPEFVDPATLLPQARGGRGSSPDAPTPPSETPADAGTPTADAVR